METEYSRLSGDELENHLNNFLITSWSYSKVTTFARNEKAFEMEYVYNLRDRRSASAVAGQAYHKALETFFTNLNLGIVSDIVDLQDVAYAFIDNVPANDWKIQKTTPTVDDCKVAASKKATAFIQNFMSEMDVYEIDNIAEILGVEMYFEEWLNVNGMDVPIPCHAQLDLVVRMRDGRVVIIDHKGRTSFTGDQDIAFVSGKQAITYVLNFESKTKKKVDEVWFIENKASKNKDNSPQLKKFVFLCTEDQRRLFEALLFEPLSRMITAISDPDYVYIANDTDTLTDKATLYNFWAKTMIAEVDAFAVPEDRKEMIRKRLKKIKDSELASISPNVIRKFKANASAFITYDLSNKDMTNTEKIEHTLRTFGIIVSVEHEIQGYSSNTYLLKATAGVALGNIAKYRLDIANALNVPSVRIGSDLVVYDGQSFLSIEANKKREKDLFYDEKYLQKGTKKLPIGIDNYGNTVIWNLDSNSTPHMLICGATGSGKSVCIKSTIAYAKLAGVTRIIIFDPKYEFCEMSGAATEVQNDIEEIESRMAELVKEMQQRAKDKQRGPLTMIVFDEFADAVQSARSGRELDIRDMNGKVVGREKSLEENLKMILQKGRSLGYRVMAATQRASTQVITGDAKVNFPVQVCFRVPKAIDSKVVIDEEGAEGLAGCGDGLMKSPEYLDVVRFQGFFKKS